MTRPGNGRGEHGDPPPRLGLNQAMKHKESKAKRWRPVAAPGYPGSNIPGVPDVIRPEGLSGSSKRKRGLRLTDRSQHSGPCRIIVQDGVLV